MPRLAALRGSAHRAEGAPARRSRHLVTALVLLAMSCRPDAGPAAAQPPAAPLARPLPVPPADEPAGASSALPPPASAAPSPPASDLDAPEPASAASAPCCRVCRKGKACGDTCIAAGRTCHTPPGCACDGP